MLSHLSAERVFYTALITKQSESLNLDSSKITSLIFNMLPGFASPLALSPYRHPFILLSVPYAPQILDLFFCPSPILPPIRHSLPAFSCYSDQFKRLIPSP